MALFKYTGTVADLDTKVVRDGFVYATVEDPTSDEVAQWHVDIGDKRYRIAAASLIDEDGNVHDISEFVTINDIIDIEHGGTGAATAEGARDNLNVYSKSETYSHDQLIKGAITKSFNYVIAADSWSVVSANGYYQATVVLDNTDIITCGEDGNVPPQISINDRDASGALVANAQELQDAWSEINYASTVPYDESSAEPTNYITFYARANMREKNIDIPIIVTDNK